MHLRALIVDDEAPARDELLYLLQAHPDVEAVQASTAEEALNSIAQAQWTWCFRTSRCPARTVSPCWPGAILGAPAAFVFVTAFDSTPSAPLKRTRRTTC